MSLAAETHAELETALRPPRASAGALASVSVKRSAEEFRVQELPAVAPDGDGSHLWLELEREDMNTAYAATVLARVAGVSPRDVGYAGLKDRHARTRQWFSIPSPPGEEGLAARLAEAGLQVMACARHGRKLRRGALSGNRFQILVHGEGIDAGGLHGAVARLAAHGVPNYFGPQRFGHGAGNLARARELLENGGRMRDRHRRSLYLSAARSWLFNKVLAARVRAGTWCRVLPGEAVLLAGTASFFSVEEPDEALNARVAGFDVHPSGPLWGRGKSPAAGEAGAAEAAALVGSEVLMEGLEWVGLSHERRALRVKVEAPEVRQGEAGGWWLAFTLPAGAYATVVLRELFDVEDASAPHA